jgi:hypothetical protein
LTSAYARQFAYADDDNQRQPVPAAAVTEDARHASDDCGQQDKPENDDHDNS